ncbi:MULTISPECIES: nucleotidyltransferase family protein [unclassified Sphingomonas]|uniref:nucleotidyltransferase family protein n=1 Tax=unclassified Sphingomonas TaxID=196159 RepID=UPI002151E8D1|nr:MULTISPECIES: nucleotidyltransferase domain-containing protein [unclassified Sphingomonas]MCR5872286.1 nucleotidyltransferase domain-containing protein [Sphingomonas sp. J344]UUX99414.1 nucleotidyltransferase domain-containing protein [Sphingomonas sp. J315]
MIRGVPTIVADCLVRWAANTPQVERMWLFGSRARGTHRIDSDIDLAVELVGWDSDDPDKQGEALADWIFNADDWRHQLRGITPLNIDLNPMSLEDQRVWPAVRREGVMVFERG